MKKKDLLLSVASGVVFSLSFPNLNLGFLAWFALVFLFLAIEGKNLIHAFVLGIITGFISFLGILYWIIVAVHTYGNIPLVLSGLILLLLIAYLSLYFGVFTFLTRYLQMHFGFQMILLCPFLWVGLEYLRSFLLSGFPWAILGYSQHSNLPFIQSADILGAYGLSFALVLTNVAFYLIIHQWPTKRFPYRVVITTILILISFFIYGYAKIGIIERKAAGEPSLKVGLIQGNIDQSVKWDESFRQETMAIYERLSLETAKENPDLMIWPETATPFFFEDAREYRSHILQIPVKTKSFLLFGSPSYKMERGKVSHYNSAYLASPAGEIVGKYDKIHLVPFGEYVPLSELLFFIGSLGEGIGNFKSGKEIFNFSLPQGKFGVLICFEIIFPDLCRRFVKEGANFLVTITNDAWFGKTSAPYQHFSIAVFRAVENRVFIARAANTGISGLIAPTGKILDQGSIFKEETISGTIHLMSERTFYTQYGDIFAWICSALSVFFPAVTLFRKTR